MISKHTITAAVPLGGHYEDQGGYVDQGHSEDQGALVDQGVFEDQGVSEDHGASVDQGAYEDQGAYVDYGVYEDQGAYEDQGVWDAGPPHPGIWAAGFGSAGIGLDDVGFVGSAGTNASLSVTGGRSNYCAKPRSNNAGVHTFTFTKTLTELTIGRTYRWSMYVSQAIDIGSTDRVQVGVTGISSSAITSALTPWTEKTYDFTATATTHSLVITGYEDDPAATSSSFLVDDMYLSAQTTYVPNVVWVPNMVWIPNLVWAPHLVWIPNVVWVPSMVWVPNPVWVTNMVWIPNVVWVPVMVWVANPVWVDISIPLNVIDAQITLDESWAPYAQASLTCAIPALGLEDIDPRLGRRIRIRLRQVFGESYSLSALSAAWAGTTLATQTAALASTFLTGISATYGQPYNAQGVRPSTQRSLDLVLRTREVDHAYGTMYLTAASDESLLQDYALVATAASAAGSSSVRAICAWVLGKVGLILYPGSADGTVEADSTDWLPGQSAWDYLRPLVNAAGLRLWCDEWRNFRLTDPADGTSGGLSVSAKYATGATDALDREQGWYDAVVVTYSWRDAEGNDLTAYDTASAPGYSKVLSLTYDRPYPGPWAAAAMLDRVMGRGRLQALSAVSDYGATPGMALTVTLPSTPIQTGLVASVVWQVPSDEMSLTARDLITTPVSAWAYAQAGVAWNEIPVGTDWTEYVYEPVGVI